ncbi:PorT family protein [Microvirga sp. STR05]|uniref:PorT family protein n=1 Tax=Hymenobacter duratus TaxID=2771356 RepID=A0ABR8JIA8_9BACT|nr:porin family protein [Hymenobacter duratus]MBD2714279.1 PorT family protein [Hymenobacter duratus]MBR7949182.1 PorT family protein [Microvirga sp. STR05]
MKKLILTLALAAGAASLSHAQGVKLGVKVGASYASVAGDDTEDAKYKLGFNGGLTANFGFSDLISFQPELLYSQKGFQFEDDDFDYKAKQTYHYVDVPLLLRINADGPFFELGPQVGVLLGQKAKVTVDGEEVDSDSDSDLEGYNRVDFGYIAGVGYQLESGLSVGVRYNGGIGNIFENNDSGGDDSKVRNSVFQLQLGYVFGGN